jgi:hypothetical protein
MTEVPELEELLKEADTTLAGALAVRKHLAAQRLREVERELTGLRPAQFGAWDDKEDLLKEAKELGALCAGLRKQWTAQSALMRAWRAVEELLIKEARLEAEKETLIDLSLEGGAAEAEARRMAVINEKLTDLYPALHAARQGWREARRKRDELLPEYAIKDFGF